MKSHADTVVCDDIRFEVDGKISLIGVYGPDLIVPVNLPIFIPKLCFFIQARIPPDEYDKKGIKIAIFGPGGTDEPPAFSHEFVPDFSKNDEVSKKIEDEKSLEGTDLERMMTFNFPISVQPMILKEDGYIRIRVWNGDKLFKAGALRVLSRPPNADPAS